MTTTRVGDPREAGEDGDESTNVVYDGFPGQRVVRS